MVEKWHVQEGDILQPGVLMVSLETPPGFFDIPTPPKVTVPLPVEGTVSAVVPSTRKVEGTTC